MATKPRATNNPVAQYVRRLYSRSTTLLLCEAALFAAIGVLMFIKPLWFLATVMFVIGIILAAFGAYRTIVGLAGDGRPGTSRGLDITFGLLNVLIGCCFACFRSALCTCSQFYSWPRPSRRWSFPSIWRAPVSDIIFSA